MLLVRGLKLCSSVRLVGNSKLYMRSVLTPFTGPHSNVDNSLVRGLFFDSSGLVEFG